MKDYYKPWNSEEFVAKFESKASNDFFASETHFLEQIGGNIESVLDIGCACGGMIGLLHSDVDQLDYTGIDIVESFIKKARAIHPQAHFILGNALDFHSEERFDLVNATGVFQHDPAFEPLLEKMIDLSRRYVLFDAKVSDIPENVIDREIAYRTVEGERLFFIILSWSWLQDWLTKLDGVASYSVLGYETSPNTMTVMPASIEKMASFGVLLEIGDGPPAKGEFLIPDFLGDAA